MTHFEFIQRLGNPCGIVGLEHESIGHPEYTSSSASTNYYYMDDPNNTLFYESMLIAVDTGLKKLRLLQDPDQVRIKLLIENNLFKD